MPPFPTEQVTEPQRMVMPPHARDGIEGMAPKARVASKTLPGGRRPHMSIDEAGNQAPAP